MLFTLVPHRCLLLKASASIKLSTALGKIKMETKNKKEFERRRQQFFKHMQVGSVAVLPSASLCTRSLDTHFPFRQDSSFYYLTGFPEPEALAVFIKQENEEKFILFNRERNPEKEQWDGPRIGQMGAIEHYGVNEAYPISELSNYMPKFLEDCLSVYVDCGRNPAFDQDFWQWVNTARARARSGI